MSMAWSDRKVAVPPLGELEALEVICGPCGRGKRMEGEALTGLRAKGFVRVDELKGRLLCRECGERHRLSLMPVFRRPSSGAARAA